MEEFKYIWKSNPIDFWGGATIAADEETERVLSQMPEDPRDGIVFEFVMPGDVELAVVYACKADNNGTIYYFSDTDVFGYYSKYLELMEEY